MKPEALKGALDKRRAGLDITIKVEAPQQKEGTDLAPPGEPKGHMDEMQDKALIQDELAKAEVAEGDDTDMHEALMGPMSGPDMEDLKGRKPRSLMERAKMAHIGKK